MIGMRLTAGKRASTGSFMSTCRHAICSLSLLTLALLPGGASAVECGMSHSFGQPDSDGEMTRVVWSDEKGTALLFIDSLNVNTDGTRRSYSVADFWGEETALNNLCNAMTDKCAGLTTSEKRARRILTQKALAQDWPANLLAETRISPTILPHKGGRPCPLVDGYLVSATALHKKNVSDLCDLDSYLDALVVPAIVLPGNPKGGKSGFAHRNAGRGDLAVALVPGQTDVVPAVVGDIGPVKQLGEGSIALAGRLLGKTTEPVNYLEIRGKKPFEGKAWTVQRVATLIFPGTRDGANPYMTNDRITEQARQRFLAWGGIERLAACVAAYEKGPA